MKSVNSYQIGTHNLWLKFYLDCEDQTILVKLGTNSSDVLLEISKILDTQPNTICQWLWLQCHIVYTDVCYGCLTLTTRISWRELQMKCEGSLYFFVFGRGRVWGFLCYFDLNCVTPLSMEYVSEVSPSFMPFSLFCSTRKHLRYSGFR